MKDSPSGVQLRVLGGSPGHTVALDKRDYKLGRFESSESGPGILRFQEPTVSRLHAELRWNEKKGGFEFFNQSSTNVTSVEGKRLGPGKSQLVHPGDRLQIGLVTLQLEPAPQSQPKPKPASPVLEETAAPTRADNKPLRQLLSNLSRLGENSPSPG